MNEETKALMQEYGASNVRTYELPVVSEQPKWNQQDPCMVGCADWCRLSKWTEEGVA